MSVTQKNLNTYACALICADLMVSYMYQLKDTPFYKQGIKNKCNSLSADLEEVLKADFDKPYRANESYMVNCMTHLESFVKLVSDLHSGEIIEYTQLLLEYRKDKEEFLSKHEIVLKKIDE